MAIGDTYATVDELKSRLSIPSSNVSYDEELVDSLTAASEAIERCCNRQFNKAAAVSVRIFEPVHPYLAEVDDFYSTTGLVVETDDTGDGTYETLWASTDYELYPFNGILEGQPGWPFYEIQSVGAHRFPYRFRGRRKAMLRVTALWGWSNVPAPVKVACLLLAAKNFQMKDAPLGVQGMADIGVIRVQDDRLATAKLQPYIRNKVMVG